MGLLTFKGGLHPYDGKELSKDKPILEYLPKGEMVYPVSQHIGAPAAPCVAKGDRVLVGQRIAEAAGFVSANIHSSVWNSEGHRASCDSFRGEGELYRCGK